MILALSVRNVGNKSLILFLAAVPLLSPLWAKASELFSESVDVPPLASYGAGPVAGWNNFNLLLWGNPALPTQDPTDTNTDPFAVNGVSTITTGDYTPAATDAGDALGPGPITIGGLTRVTFSGSVPINRADIPNQGLSNPTDQVQFGLVGPANNTIMNFLGQHWGGNYISLVNAGSYGYLSSVPIVSVTPHPAPPSLAIGPESFDYIVDFIKFTQDGVTGSEWVEFPYLPGQQPTFTYSGWADAADAIHFTENYIQTSPTMIPLDDLNYADDPPPILDPLPGAPTVPAFTEETNPDDIIVAAPEPGMMAIMLGAAMAIGRRRK